MELDQIRTILIVLATVSVFLMVYRNVTSVDSRIIFAGLIGGFLIYSGFGAAYADTPYYLMISYFIMILAMSAGFIIGNVAFATIGRKFGDRSIIFFKNIDTKFFAKIVILTFLMTKVIDLTYPVFKIDLLLSPPNPDISMWFNARFEEYQSPFTKILFYIQLIITPFVYIAFYFIRKNLSYLIFLIFLIRYMEYVNVAYIPRGTAMADVLIIAIIAWREKKHLRPFLLSGAFIALPFILNLLGQYTSLRAGSYYQYYQNADVFDGALNVLRMETRFLPEVGVQVIESGQTVNLWHYLTWIITLPIPEFLKPNIPVALVNYEISSLVLGQQPGDRGFYVLLSGLLAESYYLFGQSLFWIHGLFSGLLAGFFARLFERVPHYRILCIYVTVIFVHSLNRGGIAATLPLLINGFLGFYLFLVLISRVRRSRGWTSI